MRTHRHGPARASLGPALVMILRASLGVVRLRIVPFVAFVALASAEAQTAAPTVEDFAWLEGTWLGALDVGDGDALAEVRYMAPRAGTIVGSFRLTKDGRVLVLELFSLVEAEGRIEMRIRHFDQALTPWEDDAPIVLVLDSVAEGSFVFRNHVHDSPRWSYLEPLDANRFRARSEIFTETGEMSEIEIMYERGDS